MLKTLILLIPLLISCSQMKEHHHDHKTGHMNEKFLDPQLNAEQWNQDFSDKNRDVVVHKEAILNYLPIKKGYVIADVGAGTGMFEKGLSQKTGPKGKVYAVEIAPAFVQYMKERFQKENLKNVEVVLSDENTTTLKENSVDMIVVIDTYHHFEYPKNMLKEFYKILKKNGHLVIVDFNRTTDSRPWVLEHIKKTKEEYVQEIIKNDFVFVREAKIPFKESFQLLFQKI